jgi:hypothetical protein
LQNLHCPLSKVSRGGRCTGSDNIFVDDVSRRIVEAVVEDPAPLTANPVIMWATNGLPASYQTVEACVNPRKWIIQPPRKWSRFCIRIEGWLTWLIMGQKAPKPLLGFYRSYTYFTTNTFDFEQVAPTTPKMLAVASLKWLAILKEDKMSRKLKAPVAVSKSKTSVQKDTR